MSNVDPSVPIQGKPTTQSVRDNFSTIKTELEAFQSTATVADGAALVSYKHGGSTGAFTTGAVAGDVQGKLDNWLSVTDFKPSADGSTDDLAVFQAWATAVAASGSKCGHIPAGNYALDLSGGTVSSPVRVLFDQVDNITIMADPGAIFTLNEPTITQLHADTDPSTGGYDAAVAFSFIGCINPTFIGGRFVGEWDGIEELDLFSNEAPRVKGIAFNGCRGGRAINVRGSYVTGNLVNVRGSGLTIDGIYRRSEDCLIIDCYADHCAENGLNIMGGTFRCSVQGGLSTYNQASGAELGGNHNAIIGLKTFGNWLSGFSFGGNNHFIAGVAESSLNPLTENDGFGVYITGGYGHVVRVETKGNAREACFIFPSLSGMDVEITDVDSCAIAPTGGDNVIRVGTAISNSRISLRAQKRTTRATGTIAATSTQDGRTTITLDASASASLEEYVGLPVKITGLSGGGTGYAIVAEYTTSKIAVLDRLVSGVVATSSAYVIGANGARGVYITAPTKCEIVANGVIGYTSASVLTDGTGANSSIRGYGDAAATAGTGVVLSGYTRVGGSNIPNQLSGATISGALSHTGSTMGVFGTTAVSKQTVSGSTGANAALQSLLTALAAYGLITDSTT